MKIVRFCAVALLGGSLGLAGCSAGGDAPESLEAQADVVTDDTEQAPRLAFEDPTDDGFRLDVYELEGSDLVLSVSMPAGNDELLEATQHADTLSELYELLHPGAEMPAELARLVPALEVADLAPRAATELAGANVSSVEKSVADFGNRFCRTKTSGAQTFTAEECTWALSVSSLTVSAAKNIRRGDRTYYYNRSGANARLVWVSRANITFVLGTVVNGAEGFLALGAGNAADRFLGRMSTTSGSKGELGLTWHFLQP
jgi:hypothetical protein